MRSTFLFVHQVVVRLGELFFCVFDLFRTLGIPGMRFGQHLSSLCPFARCLHGLTISFLHNQGTHNLSRPLGQARSFFLPWLMSFE